MKTNPTAPLLLAGLSAFQVALAAGAPWGRLSYGGQHPERLPPRLRATSAVTSLVYGAGAAALASPRTSPRVRRALIRGCIALGAVGTVVNAVSPSRPEKLWSLWALALVVTSFRDLRRAAG